MRARQRRGGGRFILRMALALLLLVIGYIAGYASGATADGARVCRQVPGEQVCIVDGIRYVPEPGDG